MHERRVQAFLSALLLFAQGCASAADSTQISRMLAGSGQWDFDHRLTHDPAISQLSYHFTKSIAADETGKVHIVWYDTRDGDPQIYYKRSMNHGAAWGPDVRLSDDPGPKEQPAIAISASSVYVVWHDLRDGSMDVYLKRSLDAGGTWGPDVKLSHGSGDSMYPSVAVSGSHVHVVFADDRDGRIQVYYTRSIDRGASWTPEVRLSDLPFDSWTPSVAASGGSVYVAWTDTRDGNEEEYFKRSMDGGMTWDPDTRLTNDVANSWAPVIAASGTTVHFAWFTQKDSRVQPRDAEHKLDDVMALLLQSVEAEPAGVVLSVRPKTTKQRIEVKMRKIHAASPAWIAQGGDVAKFRALLRAYEQTAKPAAPFEAEKQLDEAMQIVGLPPTSPALGAKSAYDLDALQLQARMQNKMRQIELAVPAWVQRSGDIKQLRAKLIAFNRLISAKHPSLEEREKTLDTVMQLIGVSFTPEEETSYVYYLDAMQERIQEKVRKVQAAAPAWVQRGGDPKRLEAILAEVERMAREGTTEWQIYYRRSTDRGATWEPEVRLMGPTETSRRPSIDVVGQDVHLVWFEMKPGSEGVYYRHSPDGGLTWGPETYLVEIKSDWVHPSVSASRDFVHVVWVDSRDGNPEIYYKRKVSRKWTWKYGE